MTPTQLILTVFISAAAQALVTVAVIFFVLGRNNDEDVAERIDNDGGKDAE